MVSSLTGWGGEMGDYEHRGGDFFLLVLRVGGGRRGRVPDGGGGGEISGRENVTLGNPSERPPPPFLPPSCSCGRDEEDNFIRVSQRISPIVPTTSGTALNPALYQACITHPSTLTPSQRA
ncbi:hypothetical protein BaRGS_00007576 [Batillaria attramentaria]|uniref:Uncharacterized protein n=1 Tax=Batillaria attramentaria TaxID=370345 RepID=A0ABD0LPJ3_9CAEN